MARNRRAIVVDSLNKQKFIFGSIFLIANKLQVIGDQYLDKDGMTTKQWLLTAVVSQFGDNPPTLTEVSELMGSSRQNVKQLALKLQEKGFLDIEKDAWDGRALRLKLRDKSRTFWENREEQDAQFIRELFQALTEAEIDAVCSGLDKLLKKVDELERAYGKQQG